MTVPALLAELRTRDIQVWADDDRLHWNAPAGVLTPELRDQLRQRKSEILEFLRGPAELSFSQQRLWLLDQIEPGGAAYIIAGALELRGALDASALERALSALVHRHESLRTLFVNTEGEPLQVVSERGAWTLAVADLSGEVDARERLRTLLREEASRGFDLARGPLFRARLYRLAPDTHVLLLAMHHIISDGWSLGILNRDLGELYGRFCQGEAATLPVLRLQYRDFARWQRSWLEGAALEGLLSHWRSRLAGAPQVLELPADRPRPAVESQRGASYSFTLPLELAQALRGLARPEGATLFMTLLSGFTLLLSRYSGQQDLLVGTPVANRSRAEIEDMVGFFVNTLVLRADLSGDLSASQYLARMREVCLDAYTHQDLPFERLVEEMQPERDLSRNPLFQVMFVLQNAPLRPLELPGLALRPVDVELGAAQFDLTLHMEETAEGLSGSFEYATDLFDEPTIARMATHLRLLLDGMSATPERCVWELPLLTEAERHQLLVEWNQTDTPYPTTACVHSQIEEQAERTPERTALVFEDAPLSYRALNERANRLAARLIKLGVGPDRLVGVHMARSIDMVVATLAVLKAGGAYVPLDPGFPGERIRYMIKDAGLAVILTQKALRPEFSDTAAQVVFIDDALLADAALPTGNPAIAATAANLAYVMYTSGSTGRPKGVMVEHRNVMNFFAAMDACIDHDPPGTWLAVTSLSFDISVLELFWTLARGFKVVIQGNVEDYFAPAAKLENLPLGFSLFMWGNDDAPGRDKYRLMLEGAKYFDRNGFEAVWTPERHFHAFGGPYPNPSVTGAALAAVTERIAIRAGSCVSPLHHPIRIAEEWAVVDNLSNGRVALAFASGWQPNDFVLRPENHANNKGVMLEQIDQVRRLWRGEKVPFRNPLGKDVPIETLPRPVQPELPFWVTTAGNPDTYRQAGELGANVLTHLLGQAVDEVGEKIAIYREARAAAGHDPATGRVTLMLHTFVGDDDDAVRELVRQPMKDYLRSSLKLMLDFAWSFPAFKRPGGGAEKPQDMDLRSLSDSEIDAILDFAFERYFETSGLFGTPSTCAGMVERCKRAGVDEIACLLDFGVPTERVLASLSYLNQVREQANSNAAAAPGRAQSAERFSVAAQITRHGVTHLQCTPSLARMLLLDRPTRAALARIRQMLVGGEALPVALARELEAAIGGDLRNMYGPTETTVWSATHPVASSADSIPIGRPIGNTQIYILDGFGRPVPAGVPGELFIGGAGVARGYLQRPELTSERFSENLLLPEVKSRVYRTGDLARFLPDGCVEFLGREDYQVKIRGYRVELEEIEAVLAEHPDVRQAAVHLWTVKADDARIVACCVPAKAGILGPIRLRKHLRARLPEYMVPQYFLPVEEIPLTPNGKVDRRRLPTPVVTESGIGRHEAPADPVEATIAEIWTQLIHPARPIGRIDKFFEMGGHSLLGIKALRQIENKLGVRLEFRVLIQESLADIATRCRSEIAGEGGHGGGEASATTGKR